VKKLLTSRRAWLTMHPDGMTHRKAGKSSFPITALLRYIRIDCPNRGAGLDPTRPSHWLCYGIDYAGYKRRCWERPDAGKTRRRV
jgi:hypothetical protein